MALLPLLTLHLMSDEPRLENREARPYAAIQARVAMKELPTELPKLWNELGAWLDGKGIERTGPTLIRYLEVDMDKGLLIDVGWPVENKHKGNVRVRFDEIPAGRYVSLVHRGDFSGNVGANARLQEWAKAQGLKWKMDRERWSGRYESYPVDPGDTPDAEKWVTEISYQVEGG